VCVRVIPAYSTRTRKARGRRSWALGGPKSGHQDELREVLRSRHKLNVPSCQLTACTIMTLCGRRLATHLPFMHRNSRNDRLACVRRAPKPPPSTQSPAAPRTLPRVAVRKVRGRVQGREYAFTTETVDIETRRFERSAGLPQGCLVGGTNCGRN
jgi:hypothetical protein